MPEQPTPAPETNQAEVNPVEYRTIPGFPGYRVGDDGSVWSCKVHCGVGRGKWSLDGSWRQMKIYVGHKGRAQIKLQRQDGKGVVRRVCRLVLEGFVGPCPQGMEACHDPDFDPMNCRLTNLRWDTRQANVNDMVKHGRQRHGSGRPCGPQQLSAVTLSIAAEYACGGTTYKFLGKKHNLDPSRIGQIVREVRKKASMIGG